MRTLHVLHTLFVVGAVGLGFRPRRRGHNSVIWTPA